jgi:hypothetical protein
MADGEAKLERERILQVAAESKRLARARTLEAVAAGRIASLADNHPQRRDMERKLRGIKDNLRAQERGARP